MPIALSTVVLADPLSTDLSTRAPQRAPETRMRFVVDGDGGMLLRAVSSRAEVVRIATRLKGPVIEATSSRIVVAHGGVRVTLRYLFPEPLSLEWLAGLEVTVDITHATGAAGGRTPDGVNGRRGPGPLPFEVQCLVIRDLQGGVLVSACDGEEIEPAGLDLAVREVVTDRRIDRPHLAFTTGAGSTYVEVGDDALVETSGQRFRAYALRAGRRPAFYLRREW